MVITRQASKVIIESASEIHDCWRKQWNKYPRNKTGNDQRIKNGENINTEFRNLKNIKNTYENIASAVVAYECCKRKMDLETASNMIHDRWISRNSSWASDEQKQDYSKLSEFEKEKDREVYRIVRKRMK
jgi:hypothetical protein